jgi:hypothetical protein
LESFAFVAKVVSIVALSYFSVEQFSNRRVTETNDPSLNRTELVLLVHELFHLFLAVAESKSKCIQVRHARLYVYKEVFQETTYFVSSHTVLR